jgi:cell division protein FtsW (lipid II flippase)
MLYVGGGIVAFLVGAAAAVQVAPHVQDRIDIWIDPWATPRTTGYQIVQSLYSIADGGIFGTGFGRGFVLVGKQTVIPDAQTDFIFSVIATETGLAGAAGLLLVYLAFVYRGMKIASMADDGVTKLLPLTGITLPFVSYGGSSVVANFGLLALLLCVSERVNREGAGA